MTESLLPFVRRRTFMRRFAALGQSYRRSIEEAHIERERARGELQRFIDSLAPRIDTNRDFASGSLVIHVEVDERLMRSERTDVLLRCVADSILRRLVETQRDYRGDMRQTEMQRLLGA